MLTIAMLAHLLGVIVWVGGMFFAHMALRPTAVELLEPPQRLPLLCGTLRRFFRWVWLAVVLILASGYWLYLGFFNGQVGLYVHLMQLLGLLMVALFVYVYSVPFGRLGRALEAGDLPAGGAALARIRQIIGINLSLGLITTVIAVSKLG